MNKVLIFVAAIFFVLVACANNKQQPETVSPPVQKEITAGEATRLASTHLALKKQSWGEAQSVSERDGRFYISYKTPERELRLIGQRMLIVDKSTGVVSYQKRR